MKLFRVLQADQVIRVRLVVEDYQVLLEKEVKQENQEKLENEDLQGPLDLKDHPVVPVKRDLREREELVEHKVPLVLQVQLVQRVPLEILAKKDPMYVSYFLIFNGS